MEEVTLSRYMEWYGMLTVSGAICGFVVFKATKSIPLFMSSMGAAWLVCVFACVVGSGLQVKKADFYEMIPKYAVSAIPGLILWCVGFVSFLIGWRRRK